MDHEHNDFRPAGFLRVLVFGVLVFVLFALAAIVLDAARASEVPPLIADMKRLVGTVRKTLAGEAREGPKEAQAGEGGMCVAPLVEDLADDIPERATVERYIASCSRRPGRLADPFQVLELVRLERDIGAPDGLLAATWCLEAAMRNDRPARGDWRQGVAMARGPFQLWAPIRAWCGLTEAGVDSLLGAARCYWARVLDRAAVRGVGCDEPLRVGEALAAGGPGYLAAGCYAESSHWRAMKAMR